MAAGPAAPPPPVPTAPRHRRARPQPGDYTIIKPRWSAFFQTELDLILRRLDVRTVILTGTTTPTASAPPAMTPSLWSTTPWC
ncbi:MAG: cysteine hydrolase family protein [Dysosmobacter welbionis]